LVRVLVLQNWVGDRLSGQWPHVPPPEYSQLEFAFDGGRPHDKILQADVVVVLNGVLEPKTVKCPPDRVWALIQEPPSAWHREVHKGQPAYSRVYTSDRSLRGEKYRQFWGALEWHIGLSYEELRAAPYPEKTTQLTWVTSNLTMLEGHRRRMEFMVRLSRRLPVELWGRGIRPIPKKWDAIYPSKYTIAFENFSGSQYWSEKISDCFLAYSTPIYYGSPDIERFFPKGSFFLFDPCDPLAVDRIADAMKSGWHEENMPALLEARELCLHDYNTLYFISREVMASGCSIKRPVAIRIKALAKPKPPWPHRIWWASIRILRRLLPYTWYHWLRSLFLAVKRVGIGKRERG
jgi:hypothetical protein